MHFQPCEQWGEGRFSSLDELEAAVRELCANNSDFTFPADGLQEGRDYEEHEAELVLGANASQRYCADEIEAGELDSFLLEHYDAIVELMDDEVRERVHMDVYPCSEAEFLGAYLREATDDLYFN